MRKIYSLFGVLILSMSLMSCGGSADGLGGGGGGGGGAGSRGALVVPPTRSACRRVDLFHQRRIVQPVALSVAANAAVTWSNDSGVDHNVTFDDPTTALAVGTGAGGTFTAANGSTSQRKFATSGTAHPFHCTIHPGMTGTVNVQ